MTEETRDVNTMGLVASGRACWTALRVVHWEAGGWGFDMDRVHTPNVASSLTPVESFTTLLF